MTNSTKNQKPHKSHKPHKSQSSKRKGDQSFDDRAAHLKKNIYGSDKGRLRLMILQRDLQALVVNSEQPLNILDAGCGSGLMTEWALQHGHRVTACDSAQVMIDEVTSRLGDHPNLRTCHATVQEFADATNASACGERGENNEHRERYDLIFCHAVFEWIDDKDDFLRQLTRLLKPDGTLSLMFYNAWAREMAQLVYGNFDYIDRGYQVRQRVKLSPHYPAFPDVVEKQLNEYKLTVTQRSGIRIFYDIIRDRQHYQTLAEDIIRHELRISQQYPYWQMGRYVHYLATFC